MLKIFFIFALFFSFSLNANELSYRIKVDILDYSEKVNFNDIKDFKSAKKVIAFLKRNGEVKKIATKEFIAYSDRHYSSSDLKYVSYVKSCTQFGDRNETCYSSVIEDGYNLDLFVSFKRQTDIDIILNFKNQELLSIEKTNFKVQLPKVKTIEFKQSFVVDKNEGFLVFVQESSVNSGHSDIILISLKN